MEVMKEGKHYGGGMWNSYASEMKRQTGNP